MSELYSAAGLRGDSAKKADAIIGHVHEAGGDVTVMSCYHFALFIRVTQDK